MSETNKLDFTKPATMLSEFKKIDRIVRKALQKKDFKKELDKAFKKLDNVKK